MSISPADVVLIDFPFSELPRSKRRPALVVSPSDRLGDFTCLAITSKQPQENAIEIDSQDMLNGTLPKTSWARYDKIFTLNVSLVHQSIGSLKEEKHKEIMTALCKSLDCNTIASS